MYRTWIILIINVFFVEQISAQKDSTLYIKEPLIKKIEFKDTVSENEMYHKCQQWKLSLEEVYKIFSLSTLISSEQKESLYNWLPCYYKTEVSYRGCSYTMVVNAASFIVLFNNSSTLYFGCGTSDCERFFVLSGGNASSD